MVDMNGYTYEWLRQTQIEFLEGFLAERDRLKQAMEDVQHQIDYWRSEIDALDAAYDANRHFLLGEDRD